MMNNITTVEIFFAPNVVGGFAAFFSLLGVSANLITILSFLCNKNIRENVTTVFIINLCITDILFSMITLPVIAIRYFKKGWPFGSDNVFCTVYPIFNSAHLTVCMLSILAITINRYILICKTEHYGRIFMRRNIKIILIGIWLIGIFQTMPSLLKIWGSLGFNHFQQHCSILPGNGINPKATIYLINFILPTIVMIYCYCCIFKKVERTDDKSKSISTTTFKTKDNDNLALIKLMITIFCLFIIWYFLYPLILIFDPERKYQVAHSIAILIFCSHVIINPLIFYCTNKLYRTAFRQMLHPSLNIHEPNEIVDFKKSTINPTNT